MKINPKRGFYQEKCFFLRFAVSKKRENIVLLLYYTLTIQNKEWRTPPFGPCELFGKDDFTTATQHYFVLHCFNSAYL